MDANGEGWNYSERERERGVSFGEGLGGSGVRGGGLTPRCFIPPKPLGVSAIRYLSLSRERANRLGSRSGVAPQVL